MRPHFIRPLKLPSKIKIKHHHITTAIQNDHYLDIRRNKRRKAKWLKLKNTKDAPRGCRLYNPAFTKVKPGSTRTGLSGFHLDDIPTLNKVALGYKSGLNKKISLGKTKGSYYNCQTSIFRTGEGFELHHKIPYAFGGKTTPDNMIPLCKKCHKEVTKAVNSRDIDQIVKYVEVGVLNEIVIEKFNTRIK